MRTPCIRALDSSVTVWNQLSERRNDNWNIAVSSNQSLERGLAILEILDKEGNELGVRELARRLSVSPPIVQRLLRSLCDASFVTQDEASQKYRIGYRALSLGASLVTEDKLVSVVMPRLRTLAETHHLNAFLAVVAGGALTYVLTLQSAGPISIRTQPGSRAAFHATAMGKALIAHEDEETVRRYLGPAPLPALTDRTVTDPEALLAELARVNEQGYALALGENLPGVTSVGARVKNAQGRPIASISVAYAPQLQPATHLAEVVRLVTAAAAAASRDLGCPEASVDRVTPLDASRHDAA